jgi:hypothetical protein
MQKHRSKSISRSRTRTRSRSRARNYKGGSYTSASTYGSYVNGSPDSQFARTFDQSGPYGARTGSEYVGAQGQWSHQPNTPSTEQLNLVQSAGKRRRKSKRGGFFGEIINQAVVPFGLLGLQQTYRKKTRGGRKTRRRRRY